MTAAFNPTLGDAKLNDVECGYTQPDGSGFTRITKYNSFLGKMEYYASFPVAERSRVNLTSSGNPVILTISPVTFDDEKRLFYCILISYNDDGTSQNTESQKQPLENVYSEFNSKILFYENDMFLTNYSYYQHMGITFN